MTRVLIDLNVRVRGNDTYAGFEDVDSWPISVGSVVEVFEPESGVHGGGRVNDIDLVRRLVYLSVDWASLTDEPIADISSAVALEPSLWTSWISVERTSVDNLNFGLTDWASRILTWTDVPGLPPLHTHTASLLGAPLSATTADVWASLLVWTPPIANFLEQFANLTAPKITTAAGADNRLLAVAA